MGCFPRRAVLASAVLVGLLSVAVPVVGRLLAGPPVTGTGCPGARTALADPPPPDDRSAPNIVLIVTDDQRWDTLYGMPSVRSLLAGHGVTFTNAFVTTPLCCPSRASTLSGRYGRANGVWDNVGPHGGATAFDDSSTIASVLDEFGYDTALVGKYLNGYALLGQCYVPPGWDDWNASYDHPSEHYYDLTLNHNGSLIRYGDDPSDYQSNVLVRRAIDFIGSASAPYFLYLAPSAPHLPAVAAPRDVGSYQDAPAWRPASYDEPDLTDKPWEATIRPLTPEGADDIDAGRRHMLESLRSLDRSIRRLISALEAAGDLDRTIVVFTSDNGFLWGEHGLTSKAWPYEESIRVPLIIRTPWTTQPRTDDHLVLNIDLAATIAELAGTAMDPPQHGRSLAPLLRGEPTRWRTDFVVEWLGRDLRSTGRGPPRYEALRTERFVLVEYENGWVELYDVLRDPLQLVNLADDPRQSDRVQRLHERLRSMVPP